MDENECPENAETLFGGRSYFLFISFAVFFNNMPLSFVGNHSIVCLFSLALPLIKKKGYTLRRVPMPYLTFLSAKVGSRFNIDLK